MNWFRELTLRRAIKNARSSSPSVKIAAIEELGTYPDDQRAMTEIVVLLGSGTPAVRRAAHDALVKAGDRAVDALSSALKDGETLVAFEPLAEIIGPRAAVDRLAACPSDQRAMTKIVQLLGSGPAEVTRAARDALVEAGDRAVDALSSALKNGETHSALRVLTEIIGPRAAVDRLANCQNDQFAMKLIVDLLGSDTAEMRSAAHDALVRAGDRAVDALSGASLMKHGATVPLHSDTGLPLQFVAFSTLVEIIGQRAAAQRMLADGDYRVDTKNMAIMDGIERTPQDHLEVLEYCLEKGVPHNVAERAIQILAKMGTPRVVAALIGVAETPMHTTLPWKAIEALGVIGGSTATSALIKIFNNKLAKTQLREVAARALGNARCPNPLKDALSDEDPAIRKIAALSISYALDPAICVPALTAALGDPDPGVRKNAIAGLGHLNCNESVAVLNGLLDHSDDTTRCLAAMELSRSGHATGKEFLKAYETRGRKKQVLPVIKGRSGDVIYTLSTAQIGPSGTLGGAHLNGCDLRLAELADADLAETDFERANLAGANLRGANLHGANLLRANLASSDLRDADLRGAGLAGAILDGAIYSTSTLWPIGFDLQRHGRGAVLK